MYSVLIVIRWGIFLSSRENSEEHKEKKSGLLEKAADFYDKKYKLLMIIPLIITLLAIGVISYNVIYHGEPIKRDVTLKGGVTITISGYSNISSESIQSFLTSKFPGKDIGVLTISDAGIIKARVVESSDFNEQNAHELILALSEKLPELNKDKYTVETIGASLGNSFFKETGIALLVAFLFMAVVVFLYFRVTVPCLAVIFSAFSDIVCTAAVTVLLGISVGTAGIAAFLMLVGYSVDTDILLTNRVLKKKKGTVLDATFSAMRTGITMSVAALAAVVASFFLTHSLVLKQIMLILMIGLLFDILNTWLTNAGILRLYYEKLAQKSHHKKEEDD